jgi:hypothetical protein
MENEYSKDLTQAERACFNKYGKRGQVFFVDKEYFMKKSVKLVITSYLVAQTSILAILPATVLAAETDRGGGQRREEDRRRQGDKRYSSRIEKTMAMAVKFTEKLHKMRVKLQERSQAAGIVLDFTKVDQLLTVMDGKLMAAQGIAKQIILLTNGSDTQGNDMPGSVEQLKAELKKALAELMMSYKNVKMEMVSLWSALPPESRPITDLDPTGSPRPRASTRPDGTARPHASARPTRTPTPRP